MTNDVSITCLIVKRGALAYSSLAVLFKSVPGLDKNLIRA